MSYILEVNKVLPALCKAADFLRQKYNLKNTLILTGEFEQEFGIKMHVRGNIISYDDRVEFPSEADYLMFVLKWS